MVVQKLRVKARRLLVGGGLSFQSCRAKDGFVFPMDIGHVRGKTNERSTPAHLKVPVGRKRLEMNGQTLLTEEGALDDV